MSDLEILRRSVSGDRANSRSSTNRTVNVILDSLRGRRLDITRSIRRNAGREIHRDGTTRNRHTGSLLHRTGSRTVRQAHGQLVGRVSKTVTSRDNNTTESRSSSGGKRHSLSRSINTQTSTELATPVANLGNGVGVGFSRIGVGEVQIRDSTRNILIDRLALSPTASSSRDTSTGINTIGDSNVGRTKIQTANLSRNISLNSFRSK